MDLLPEDASQLEREEQERIYYALQAMNNAELRAANDAEFARLQEEEQARWDANLRAELGRRIGRTAEELISEVSAEVDWYIPGVLAPGWTVKLAAREKMGKGTLVVYLLGKLERGEPTVFGDACEPVTALILTEEPEESIREKLDLFGVKRALVIYGWELAHLTWTGKVAYVVDRARREGHGIIFVDNVSRAAGVEDEAGLELGNAFAVLSDAVRPHKIAAIGDHHHKKGRADIRDKSRGGTNTAGTVEVNLDLEPVKRGDILDRRRKLTAIGRIRATVWVRTVELTEDGTDFVEVATAGSEVAPGDVFAAMVEPVAGSVLEYDARQLARLGSTTPSGYAEHVKRSKRTVQERLKTLVEEGLATAEPGVMTPHGMEETTYRWVEPEPCATPEP
jgi:hypothetical protein